MNSKALHLLEYDKILELLAACATSAPGRELCLALQPQTDRALIDTMQEETAAACSRIFARGSISFGNTFPVYSGLKRLAVGSALGAGELLSFARFLENTENVSQYGKKEREDTPDDALTGFFVSLEPCRSVTREILRCIASEEELYDDASPALRSVRRRIRAAGDRIHSEMSRLLQAHAKDHLQDSLITTRDGRYCLPVKAEHRGSVAGIVHDISSSGSTVFVEPISVVRLNNDIRELEIEEQKEIAAILASLSEMLAEYREAIACDYRAMVQLDFIFARARLALKMNASRPIIAGDRVLDLRQARHPLIDPKKVVPMDIRLGEAFDLLVITGPNTGGKTVTLKTTGLLTLMGLSGLHIPAKDRSRIGLFREIYADIGDEQSIEQSLSTFSSHMRNIVEYLDTAKEDSLVLFDELGAGTDPTEGAALAVAILDHLHCRGIRTMATTHYSEIKIYALRTSGVENASCEFDVATLSPTYRLLIGIPGKSNAFAISRKLGLSEALIEDARALVSDQAETFEDVITDLDSKRRELEENRRQTEKGRLEVEALKKEIQKEKERLAGQKARLVEEASAEARRILQEAKELADKSIRFYAKNGGIASGREMEKTRDTLREKIRTLDESLQRKAPEAPRTGKKKISARELRIGDPVHILSMRLDGTVNTLPDARGMLYVTCGIMRTKVSLEDIARLEEKKPGGKAMRPTSVGKLHMEKASAAVSEINLLGKNVDEACMELDKFIDDAAIAGLHQIRIVHGKGTGALRRGVHQYLKRNKHIKTFRLGEFGEGDAGVTIAELT